MKDIVVGIDRSPTARRAAEAAEDLAGVYNTNLHLVLSRAPDST